MNATLLDFTQRRELSLHAIVIADVERAASALSAPIMITGAFARDLHILYAYGIDTNRQSEDVDFAIAVDHWETFDALRARLTENGFQAVQNRPQRLRHAGTNVPVDLVPFAGIETSERRIEWPPDGDVVMDVFGFREALATVVPVHLPQGITTRVVSLPGLALLKIVAWNDRHLRAPRKDAHDLMLVVSNYLSFGNEERLWSDFSAWTEEADFDYQGSGARMLGHDLRALLDAADLGQVATILETQLAGERVGQLVAEMSRTDPDGAARLLQAILKGLTASKS